MTVNKCDDCIMSNCCEEFECGCEQVQKYGKAIEQKIRADYLDEIIDILNDSFPMTPSADITCGYYCAIQRLEQLKEQKNE